MGERTAQLNLSTVQVILLAENNFKRKRSDNRSITTDVRAEKIVQSWKKITAYLEMYNTLNHFE